MPFPLDQSALLAAGYEYARWEKCGTCQLPVEVWTTPSKTRTVQMDPMPSHETPAVWHYLTCDIAPKQEEPQRPQEQPSAPQIAMFPVNDPNGQLLEVGYEPVAGVLVCQFKTAKWSYAGVPESEFLKLKRVPYAYRIFTTNIKGKFTATKVE